MMNKKSIIITGGVGFIGFALAKALAKKKYKIYIIDIWEKKKFMLKSLNLLMILKSPI